MNLISQGWQTYLYTAFIAISPILIYSLSLSPPHEPFAQLTQVVIQLAQRYLERTCSWAVREVHPLRPAGCSENHLSCAS